MFERVALSEDDPVGEVLVVSDYVVDVSFGLPTNVHGTDDSEVVSPDVREFVSLVYDNHLEHSREVFNPRQVFSVSGYQENNSHYI